MSGASVSHPVQRGRGRAQHTLWGGGRAAFRAGTPRLRLIRIRGAKDTPFPLWVSPTVLSLYFQEQRAAPGGLSSKARPAPAPAPAPAPHQRPPKAPLPRKPHRFPRDPAAPAALPQLRPSRAVPGPPASAPEKRLSLHPVLPPSLLSKSLLQTRVSGSAPGSLTRSTPILQMSTLRCRGVK